ncbi:hypothetical protein PISMIDRAFT_676460 [Pisolithus microcarpus 441]|uniref:Uncharacterized protein n=1 Tax=Pisolithus microcarpus 441 TaxID=765257 RepID=A0A0C9ZUR6_9AGAM|nr:hypothetical protein PISMIDRAFT_676460 [Pisolithus microcarpus 441]
MSCFYPPHSDPSRITGSKNCDFPHDDEMPFITHLIPLTVSPISIFTGGDSSSFLLPSLSFAVTTSFHPSFTTFMIY